jgi:bifunctional UDP-N-acetylglucosamine pyrophosphorylase/glucosamine-1-phosphate N-acetyltransferase
LNANKETIALILAAGKGKRMKSELPKVLHKLADKYIVDHVIESARLAGIERQILVIGHKAEQVMEALKDRNIEFVLQENQLGTGHAVMMSEQNLKNFDGNLVILCGDMPLIKPETIKGLIETKEKLSASAVVLSVELDDPKAYGRIVRDKNGHLKAIVEYRDADEETRLIKEVNTATYCFDWKDLKSTLGKIDDQNDQREFYLTDSIEILVKSGKTVGAIIAEDSYEGFGINSVDELGEVEEMLNSGTKNASRM